MQHRLDLAPPVIEEAVELGMFERAAKAVGIV